MNESQIRERAARIKMLIMDVDGVLTNGQIIYTDSGEEVKSFDVKDGFAIKLFHRAGLKTAIITGRHSQVIEHRAKELGIEELHQHALTKLEIYEKILAKYNLSNEEAAYIGDDLVDLPVMTRVGLSVTVPDGVEDVRTRAHYITKNGAGRGAVREVIEIILKAQNLWEKVTERYFK